MIRKEIALDSSVAETYLTIYQTLKNVKTPYAFLYKIIKFLGQF